MSRIQYVTGDATDPQGPGVKIIAHCVSNNGRSYGKGFALALAKKYPKAREHYKRAAAERNLTLGDTFITEVAPEIVVVAIVAQHGFGSGSLQPRELRYGLEDAAREAIALNASVHMPRIGCGLAGGNWAEVEPVILSVFNLPLAQFVPVTVYDLPK